MLSMLDFYKSATCDATYAEFSTDVDKRRNVTSSVGTFRSNARRYNGASNTIESVIDVDAASNGGQVLQSDVGGQFGIAKPVADDGSLAGVDLSHVAEDGSTTLHSAPVSGLSREGDDNVERRLAVPTKWQVMLPLRTWTQRNMQVGCGGVLDAIERGVRALRYPQRL
ncbi:unnamed protein product [Phytophthora lilii]|uniref:Unnamed protein product n=1 Tax=Phytophthora lilii TaxID=2077276 RepID=A0A9W6X5F7_9STRA|nr:unnamed protein product [Phytophthora lilii]